MGQENELKIEGQPEIGMEEAAAQEVLQEAATKEQLWAEQETALLEQRERVAALEQTLRRERMEAAAALALTRAGARNLPAARALLELDAAALDAKPITERLEEQIAVLKTAPDTSFLFAPERPVFYGFVPAEGRDGIPGEYTPVSLTDAVRMALTPNG